MRLVLDNEGRHRSELERIVATLDRAKREVERGLAEYSDLLQNTPEVDAK